MAHRRFVYSKEQGCLVEVGVNYEQERRTADVMPDLPDYTSPIDGRLISGRAARREDLKRNNCRPREDNESAYHAKARAADDAALTRSVHEGVEKWFATTSSRKHELLEQALRSGTDTEYRRK